MEYLLGVVVSIIVEVAKKKAGTSPLGTYIALLLVSVLGGTVYFFVAHSIYWETIVQVLTAAAAFHNLVIRQLPSPVGNK